MVDYEHRGKKIRVDEETLIVPLRSLATTARATTTVWYLAKVLPPADTGRWYSERKRRAEDVTRGLERVLAGLVFMLNEDLDKQNELHKEITQQKEELRFLNQHANQLTVNNHNLCKKVATLN
ncbi:basic leucine zipper transcriptional factor ATF-like [Striga asiatica]|uniref:Basic leucine zipper transcriptional factor ATF-like n=1 Tax=Striga asiatica TaxID=4170 RepID=A0A5A7QF85_STRAF|nr:basic leucine zipper transcriptional factor ATF-like [Striga asiatica]